MFFFLLLSLCANTSSYAWAFRKSRAAQLVCERKLAVKAHVARSFLCAIEFA